MLINQTDVAVDEELEKVIITIDSNTKTNFMDYKSGYKYSSGETTEPPANQRRVYNLDKCILFEC